VIVAPAICTTGRADAVEHQRDRAGESVSKARRARSYMTCTLAMYCAGLAGSIGGLALTVGFGFSPSRATPGAGAPGRGPRIILVEPGPVAGADVPLRSLAARRHVQDAPPRVDLADLPVDLGRRALEEELIEHGRSAALRRDRDAGARPRQAAAAVDRQGERREPREGPIRSATSWSSEIELRNELLAGCGAAVRKQMSDGWPPSTNGCDTPLSTVKVRAMLFQELQVRRGV
jgi:hypothetical protein